MSERRPPKLSAGPSVPKLVSPGRVLLSSGGDSIRLNKFLAERIGVSRREADDLIAAGQVLVDGQPAPLGAHIDKSNKVCYNNKIIPFSTDFLYLAFNKPVGYVCSRRAQGSAPTLYELLPSKYQKLKTVGRLDKDSSGLILLTNDGDFAFEMTHPKFHKEKVYEVVLDRPLAPLHQQIISDYGVMLEDGPSRFMVIRADDVSGRVTALEGDSRLTRQDEARRVTALERGSELKRQDEARRVTALEGDPQLSFSEDGGGKAGRTRQALQKAGRTRHASSSHTLPIRTSSNHYTVILSEGRNRQIRRTFAALGYRVISLHRTKFGRFELSGLGEGEFVEFKM